MRPTIFDKSRRNSSGSQVIDADFKFDNPHELFEDYLLNKEDLDLPELSEVEVVRHYTNLSRDNYGVDNGTYPLGSCTMKYNPKRNDKLAALSGFRDIHPHQPKETMKGLWELLYLLQNYIAELTGMDYVSLQPAAGANGELAGLFIIRKYFQVKGESRKIILIADSAHGTNPASASMAGFDCKIIPTDVDGLMDIHFLEKELNSNVAALMLTNPSTLGLFEERIEQIATFIHKNGSLLYYDGANMNALMGIVRPGDMMFDIMHLNVHKTLSTPHGGGGPGAGPIGVKKFLYDYLPSPLIIKEGNSYKPTYHLKHSVGSMKTFFGHIDVLIKAYSYIMSMGAEGLKQASENAVLNANYIQSKLKDIMPSVYNKYCMHECLLSGNKLKITAYDFAKRLIDYNVHPPTLVGAGCVYFPDNLRSAMLIEPTETETKKDLDDFINIFYKIIQEIEENIFFVESAPHTKNISKINIKNEFVA